MVDTRSGPDGSFVLAGVLPGPTQVNVRASGFASVNNKTMTPGEEPVDVTLTPGGSIAGLVVEDDGRPIDAYRIVGSAAKSKPWDNRVEKSVGSADGRSCSRTWPKTRTSCRSSSPTALRPPSPAYVSSPAGPATRAPSACPEAASSVGRWSTRRATP